ncbi:MAG: NFACT family protein [Armatimonadetes bacterium]|nr:NFACT family protein [Armatimonadota bacterium]MBX3109905.1 NFACT family protein [Fimbriimonadaceae bacterium]
MSLRTPFDSLTLAAVLHETAFLAGAKVQRIVQLDDSTLVFGLYTKGQEHQLLVSWHPELFRIHLLANRPTALGEPPVLCMALRKYLVGGRLEFIRQRGLDRVADFGFASAHGDFQMAVELMGRHSNAVLVDGNRRILAAGKTVPLRLSKRPIRIGQGYEPPPFDAKPSLLLAHEGDELGGFEGVSPFLTKLISAGVSLSDVQRRIRENDWDPCLSNSAGAYPLDFSILDQSAIPKPNLNTALESAYVDRGLRDALAGQRSQLATQLQRVADARRAALRGIEEAIELADRAAEIQAQAELILAYQGSIRPGQEQLDAWDFQGEPVQIKLDPEMTAVENANRLFAKAKHAKERRDEVEAQGDRLRQDLTTVESLLIQIEGAATLSELGSVRAEADKRKYLHHAAAPKAKEDRPYEGNPIRELLSPGGFKVLYGTTATSNDFLTNRVAKGNDWWFHVRGQTSAHVVLQTHNQPDKVQRPDIEFAALVTVRNSVAKHGSFVPVDYTLKKYVRKPRGSAPGLAVYEREKTIHVDP